MTVGPSAPQSRTPCSRGMLHIMHILRMNVKAVTCAFPDRYANRAPAHTYRREAGMAMWVND
jgi:hypothetical protein